MRMVNCCFRRGLGLVLFFTGASAGIVAKGVERTPDVDWAVVNSAARQQAAVPIRPGRPGRSPFWNGHARAFIHPPAFDFKSVDGAKAYRFTLRPEKGEPSVWTASEPWQSVDAKVWSALAPGYLTLRVEGLDAAQKVVGVAGERKFYRAAVFRGPYPAAARDYREAARRVYAAVFRLPHVQRWLTADEPPESYDLYCYPSKILSAMIAALVRHADAAPTDREKALAIARKMANWLIARSQPAEAPLACFPPTYWGSRRKEAVDYAGQNMLVYPATAANAFLALADATGEVRYRERAVLIARTYLRIQGEDGTWPLKVYEKDGRPVRANRMVPDHDLFDLLDRVAAVTGEPAFSAAAARAFDSILKGPCVTWNWGAQFEDVDPLPPYVNLQKGVPADVARRLFAKGGDKALAREIVDWCEDQFVVWSDPLRHMDWQHWKTPTALEQYEYYTPIDASMADMVGAFSAAFAATGDRLYLEKARALADNLTRNQRPDGTIPTYFDSRSGSDWVNCMVYAAERLDELAITIKTAGCVSCVTGEETGFVPLFNGRDLSGWEGATDTYCVSPEGYLTCTQADGKGESGTKNLWTAKDYANFIIRFDVKLPPNANNGLGIRTKPNGWCSREGMELQLLDDWGDLYNGSNKLVDVHYTGSIYGVVPPARKVNGESYLNKPGEWNAVEVTADGPHIVFVLNGTTLVDADVSRYSTDGTVPADGIRRPGLHNRTGRIHWCGHGHNIYWRNIRIKELP